MHRVVVLALEGVVPFELGIASRIFGAAIDGASDPLYSVVTCTLDGGPVRTAADFSIQVDHDARVLALADTVVVPPTGNVGSLRRRDEVSRDVLEALSRVRSEARWVAICTGSFLLAAAGLLDGRTVTTHWREADDLARMFPAVCVDPEVLFVDDGDVLTSAGVAAGVDLCLHIVRRDHGSEIANAVARACVVPPWRDGGQAQYISRPVPEPQATSTAPTRAWALQRLEEPFSLQVLADHAGMSVRTFTRRFRDELGLSPGEWMIAQRVEHARLLLETTDLNVDAVAQRAGFGTATSLRQHFRDTVGVAPSAYRRTFNRGTAKHREDRVPP